MRLRADFDAPAWVGPADHHWTASPESGVERVMLDRIGDEVAVATSLVRYRPGSRFASHGHQWGEEFLVLDGVFEDEHGRYPAGTYVRNPPGSAHAPGSTPGCLLFVKLRQFQRDDSAHVVIDTDALPAAAAGAVVVHRLHHFGTEDVWLLDGARGAAIDLPAVAQPRDVLALSGRIDAHDHALTRLAWLRLPPGTPLHARFEEAGRLFVKTRPVLFGDCGR